MEVVCPDGNSFDLEKRLKEDYEKMQVANRAYVEAMKDNAIFFMAEPMLTPLIAQQELVVKGILTGKCPEIVNYNDFKSLRKEFLQNIQLIYKEEQS